MAENILIKVSGDLVDNPAVIDFIKERAQKAFVVILVGGGTEISNNLGAQGFGSHFSAAGRVIPDFSGRQLARNILEKNQQKLQDRLVELQINAVVEIPVVNLGSVLCHLNGDHLAVAASINFNQTYILTSKGRKKQLSGHNLEIVEI